MAKADVVQERWGYSIGGTGTDAVTIADGGILKIKSIAFSGNATNATGLVTSGASSRTTELVKFKSYDAGGGSLNMGGTNMFFGDKGIEAENVIVTVSHASDTLQIFLV